MYTVSTVLVQYNTFGQIVYVNVRYNDGDWHFCTRWYIPAGQLLPPGVAARRFMCFENSAIFLTSTLLYVGIAVIVSEGGPFWRSIFTNLALVLSLLTASLLTLLLLFCVPSRIALKEYSPERSPFLFSMGTTSLVFWKNLLAHIVFLCWRLKNWHPLCLPTSVTLSISDLHIQHSYTYMV